MTPEESDKLMDEVSEHLSKELEHKSWCAHVTSDGAADCSCQSQEIPVHEEVPASSLSVAAEEEADLLDRLELAVEETPKRQGPSTGDMWRIIAMLQAKVDLLSASVVELLHASEAAAKVRDWGAAVLRIEALEEYSHHHTTGPALEDILEGAEKFANISDLPSPVIEEEDIAGFEEDDENEASAI